METVVLPMPAFVGVIAVTRISFPEGGVLGISDRSTLAICLP